MPRTVLAIQTVSRTGLNPTFSDANVDGHAIDNTSQSVYLHVRNNGTGSIDVTIVTPGTVDNKSIPDNVVSVPSGGQRLIGPFPHAVYCQTNTTLGLSHAVHIDYSAVTNVTVAAILVP